MAEATDAPVVVRGQGSVLPATGGTLPLRFELYPDHFTVSCGATPITGAYRELTAVAVDQGRVLITLGAGNVRLLVEQLGAGLGQLVGELRERRARQMLTDRLIDLPESERLELVEFRTGEDHGVAQLAFHAWGMAIIPLDERLAWWLIRRADLAEVRPDQPTGRVRLDVAARPGREGVSIELLGLGLDTVRMADRVAGMRVGALGDAAAIVNGLLPGAAFEVRNQAAGLLVDGRPISREQLGDAWAPIERAVLSEPTFAATYAALVARSGSSGSHAKSWMSIAPVTPTDPTEHMSWFLVALPTDLLAFELVSEGTHATYLFRARDSLEAAVFDVSEALIDTRFLRSAIYLTEAALADPARSRQRLAVASLPSLRAARARFVGRLIHVDEESWARSLDDAIRWNSANLDATIPWPGTDQSEGD